LIPRPPPEAQGGPGLGQGLQGSEINAPFLGFGIVATDAVGLNDRPNLFLPRGLRPGQSGQPQDDEKQQGQGQVGRKDSSGGRIAESYVRQKGDIPRKVWNALFQKPFAT
jgi:hypothetical protein